MRSDYIASFSQKHQIPFFIACESSSFSLAPATSSHKSTKVCHAAVHNMKESGRNRIETIPYNWKKSSLVMLGVSYNSCKIPTTAYCFSTNFLCEFCGFLKDHHRRIPLDNLFFGLIVRYVCWCWLLIICCF